ncbi:MAG: SpoIIE family protein phosphatase [Bacteroidota bacterium]
MSTPNLQKYLYRTLVIIVAAFLFILSWKTFFTYVSTPTDENIFRDVPSKLVFNRNIPAVQTLKKPYDGTPVVSATLNSDSLLIGDLLFSINGNTVSTIKDAYDALYAVPGEEILFEIIRPSNNYRIQYQAKRSMLEQDFLALMPRFVYVSDITAGGASDRAGMKIGDLIIRINDRDFNTAIEADRILRLGQIGKTLKYIVIRKNVYVELNVELAKFGIPIAVLIFCLSGLAIMIIGLFIGYSRSNILSARLLGFGFLLIGYFVTVFAVRRDFDLTAFIIFRNAVMAVGFSVGLAFLLHASHYFPAERTELTERKWIARGYYIGAAVAALLLLFQNNILPQSIQNIGIPLLIVPAYGLFVLLKFRKRASLEYKKLNKTIRWTSAFVGVMSLIIFMFFNANPGFIGFGIYAVLLLLLPLSYLYTIGRYHLLDLNFRVRRNTQYSLITFLWAFVIIYLLTWSIFQLPQMAFPSVNIAFTGTAIEISDAPELADQRASSERVLMIGLALIVTFGFLKIRRVGQQLIDKKYFRVQFDYRKAQQELGELLATTLSMEDLAKGFVQKLSELVRLKTAGVLFFRDEQCCTCEAAHGFDGTQWKIFCVNNAALLISSIKQFHNEIRIQYLPSPIKEEFQQEGFQYLIPIRSKEKLIGAILVGEKKAETTFQQEDLAFLTSSAKQASVAIENAFLYEQLTEKERLKHELQIARRIQLESLPQTTPDVPGMDIAGISVPAMEVGGDFFDYLQNKENKLTVIIGDVSGKGTSAALYMSKVQGILRSLDIFNLSPKELLSHANKILCRDLEKRSFVTVLGAAFDLEEKKVLIARAGHLPLWYYNSRMKRVEMIVPKGLGLGLDDAGTFTAEIEEKEIVYAAGDIFLFATDGVTDAHNETRDFGDEYLEELLLRNAGSSADAILHTIMQSVKEIVGDNAQHDDETIVVVKMT